MSRSEAFDLLFGGMGKLGPGDDAHTLHVLRMLPQRRPRVVVDAGCGTGRQTLVLAGELGTPVHAVDLHRPFLDELSRRARDAGVGDLVRTHCMDMREIPAVFRGVDLLWSEGAAYQIGFAHALSLWAPALGRGGLAVVSELSWLRDPAPDRARELFASCYPDMRSLEENLALAAEAGYRVLGIHTLPEESWVEGYYDVLGPRAKSLADHPDPAVRQLARETLEEIEVFERSEGSYGYVFYALEPGASFARARARAGRASSRAR